MYRGQLKVAVMKILVKSPQSGYSLMSHLGKLTGKKPSAGSLYPILDELKKNGFVKSVPKKRKIIYSLTASGKMHFSKQIKLNEQLFSDMVHNCKMFDHLMDVNMAPFMEEVLARVKKGERPFEEIEPEMHKMRLVLLDMLNKGRIAPNKSALKKIIINCTKEMEEIK